MSELLQFIVVVAFGALCFGYGYLTAFIVTQAWRRPLQPADRQVGMGGCQAGFFTRLVAAYPFVLLHVAIAAMP
jgi:hypothetical protein